jgi:hypothetical protein
MNTRKESPKQKSNYKDTSCFPLEMYDRLHPHLKECLSEYDGREKDMLFISLLGLLSGYFPKVHGYYFGKKLYPHLYCVIGAGPASGKSIMLLPKIIGDIIHQKYLDDYKNEMVDYMSKYMEWKKKKTGDCPEKPKLQLFFIPANITAAGIIELLSLNGRGVILESEIDTLTNALNDKHGGFNDDLRKAFHHEPISYYRKTDKEYIYIANPCLTILVSGTPEQVSKLIRSPENGLFSRIIFYVHDSKPTWNAPFGNNHKKANEELFRFAQKYTSLYFKLIEGGEIEFRLTDSQKERFNLIFSPHVNEFHDMIGSDGVSVIMRLGVIFFRIAMILTIIRKHDEEIIYCDDDDFEIARLLAEVLAEHSLAVLSTLSSPEDAPGTTLSQLDVLKMLPPQFESKHLITPMLQKGFSRRSVFRIITRLCNSGYLEKVKMGTYRKTNKQ